jgi:hypothetical protein
VQHSRLRVPRRTTRHFSHRHSGNEIIARTPVLLDEKPTFINAFRDPPSQRRIAQDFRAM